MWITTVIYDTNYFVSHPEELSDLRKMLEKVNVLREQYNSGDLLDTSENFIGISLSTMNGIGISEDTDNTSMFNDLVSEVEPSILELKRSWNNEAAAIELVNIANQYAWASASYKES
jgi:hypothetical protein